MSARARVLVIQTGGTLAMATARAQTTLGAPQPLDLPTLVPQLRDFVQLEMQPLFSLDSGDLQPSHWIAIARAVHAALSREELAGVVVTHGTDTMAYTASALAFLLGPLPKPVVLTGAQRPMSDMRSDAQTNVVDAVLGATLAVPEVVIAFGSKILRGCRAIKADAWAMDAFASPACPPLVELGIGVSLAAHVRGGGPLRALDERIEPRVLAVRTFPGLDPRLVMGAIRAGVRGVVLEAYGTGNLPNGSDSSLVPAIAEATARGVPVLVVSQCPRGHVELLRYAGGAAAAAAGAIDGGDMTVEAAVAKLMIGLARYPRLEDLQAYIRADVAGERTVIAE